MNIGEKIRTYRKAAGLTQEQVAGYLGVSAPAVHSKRQIFLRIS